MTTQKQLSHLSIAAIMLVFAALPALAQTGAVDNQTAVATTSNLFETDRAGALRAALRKDRASVPSTESAALVVLEKQSATVKKPSFSLSQFVKLAAEPAVINDSQVLEFTSLEKPVFNDSSSKAIQFVPSRGPKLPWQQ